VSATAPRLFLSWLVAGHRHGVAAFFNDSFLESSSARWRGLGRLTVAAVPNW